MAMTTRTWLDRSADAVGRGVLCLVVLLGSQGACENPNEVFSGRWGPVNETGSVDESTLDLGADPVWPQLHLGHYGQEVAGIVTFHNTSLVTDRALECNCAFVEHRHLNLDAQTLVFTTGCDEFALDWDLDITRDDLDRVFLKGTVHGVDGNSGLQELRLERLADEVDPHNPSCDADPP
jgi:hypothetical protein